MKVLVDLLYIRDNINTGIGKVGLELVKGLYKYTTIDLTLLIWQNQVDLYEKIVGKNIKKIMVPVSFQSQLNGTLRLNICPSEIKGELAKQNIEVIFLPRISIFSFIYPASYRQVGVVHDVQHLKIRLLNKKILSFLFCWIVTFIYYSRINKIIAISKSTQHDIKKYTGRNSIVIHNSVTVDKSANTVIIKAIEGVRYILNVNSFWKYKNTERLIDAFDMIQHKIPHLLYLKGCSSEVERCESLWAYVKKKGLEKRVIIDIDNRSEEEMEYLYRHADLFVSPSLMEGFGLTPIEASIRKVPVIVSDIPIFRETTDELLRYFNPYSVEAIATATLEMIENPPSADDLERISNCYENKYTLEKQVESYANNIINVK